MGQLNVPVNLDDQKSLKSISKTQLVEVIKRLNKELDALMVKPSPSLGPDTQAQTTLKWNDEQLQAFLQSQDAVFSSFQFNKQDKQPTIKEDAPYSGMYEKIQFDSRKPGVITHVFVHEGESSKPGSKTILKLDSNPPKFHGNANEDVDDCLNKVKINLDIAQIPQNKYFDYLTNYCVGKAGTFMRRLRESYELKILPLTWSAFRESFIKRYKPFDHTRRIRNQLIRFRQGNDFNTYVDNF
jgi:hypothetical protein